MSGRIGDCPKTQPLIHIDFFSHTGGEKTEMHRTRLNEWQIRLLLCVQRKALMVWTGQWKNISRERRLL